MKKHFYPSFDSDIAVPERILRTISHIPETMLCYWDELDSIPFAYTRNQLHDATGKFCAKEDLE